MKNRFDFIGNHTGYGGGFTEHDVKEFKAMPTSDMFPRGTGNQMLDLMRIWVIRCEDLKLICRWWPSPQSVDRWLRNYGFEIAREGVIRGIKGYSRVNNGRLAETQEDCLHMMNYIQKVIRVLKQRSHRGQTLAREGSERCYD